MNPYMIAGAVLAVVLAYGTGHHNGHVAGKKEIQQLWDQQVAKQMQEYAAAQDAARQKEQAMQAAADQSRQEKDREIRNINARATALANSLQQRPDRATEGSSVSGAASHGQARSGCTGAELYRSDAEFLVREAERGDQLRAALRQCYAQYEAVKAR